MTKRHHEGDEPMKPHDQQYVANRLLRARDSAADAIDRLRELGYDDEASTIVAAIQAFNDTCRPVLSAVYGDDR